VVHVLGTASPADTVLPLLAEPGRGMIHVAAHTAPCCPADIQLPLTRHWLDDGGKAHEVGCWLHVSGGADARVARRGQASCCQHRARRVLQGAHTRQGAAQDARGCC
jgi:hypothetical protein